MVKRSTNFGPRPHGIYSDRDRHGSSPHFRYEGQEGKERRRSLKTLTGRERDIAFPFLSHIYFDHTGRAFRV